MNRRQSNKQWSSGIAAHPAPKNSECKNPLEKFSPASIFSDQDGILLIDCLPKDQTINAQYYSSLLVQLKDFWRKNVSRGKVNKGVLFLHDNVPAHRALATHKKLAHLGFQGLDHLPYSPDLARRTTTCSLEWKTIERSPFFFRSGGHCCCGDLVGRATFWIFFFFEWLAEVRATG